MPAPIESAPRIEAFRKKLIAEIPRFPNNRASLIALNTKHLTDLLISYIGWRLRYVAARPRNITGKSKLAADPRATILRADIAAFLHAVEAGHDLTPYLSTQPHTRGYTPAAEEQVRGADTWEDKDFILNVMGLHHFHLDRADTKSGHRGGPNEMVFASVTRDTFEILGLFTHTVFTDENRTQMTPERERMWAIYEARRAREVLAKPLSLGGYGDLGILLSSHPVFVTRYAQRHVKIIREIDPNLDDKPYVSRLYGESGTPIKPNLKWHYQHLDLGLLDEKAEFFGICEKGPN